MSDGMRQVYTQASLPPQGAYPGGPGTPNGTPYPAAPYPPPQPGYAPQEYAQAHPPYPQPQHDPSVPYSGAPREQQPQYQQGQYQQAQYQPDQYQQPQAQYQQQPMAPNVGTPTYQTPPPAQQYQPAPTAPMVPYTPANATFDANGERDWTNGICSCLDDCGTCCIATFLPCVTYGQNKSRYHHLATRGGPHPTGGDSCTPDCWAHGALTSFCLLGWVLQISTRGALRSRYRIRNGGLGDCCTSFWCNPCALTQESREIAEEERAYGKQG